MWFLFALICLALVGWGIFLSIHRNEHDEVYFTPSKGKIQFISAGLVFVLSLSFCTISAGYRGVVTRWGNVTRTLNPGAHFVIPFAEHVSQLTVQTMTVKPSEQAASHDLQVVNVQVTLAYHFDPQYISYIYSQLSDDSPSAVENKVVIPAILEAIKARIAQYDTQQLIGQRPAVRDGIESFVQARLSQYHIIPETVSITNFSFSEEYEKSIEAKVTAGQLAEKAQNDLSRIKIEADQKIAQAQGEAKALEVQKAQITPELLQLRTVEMMREKWDGKLPENYFGGNAPLPIMDVFKNHVPALKAQAPEQKK